MPKDKITREQLIKIAKIGFSERVKKFINFEDAEIHICGDVYRLIPKENKFKGLRELDDYLSIHIEEENFVQIQVGNKAFNHYAAIKEMVKMGIIRKSFNKQG